MRKLRILALIFLLLPSLVSATPRDDFFTSLNGTTVYTVGVAPETYYTQALRLLNSIATGSGGGGVVTQPTGTNLHTVVDSGSVTVTQATGTNLHAVIDAITGTVPVSGTFWQATQPVSGTITANAGTNLNTSALALDATLTGGTQKTKLVDTAGTNVGSISAAGALKVDNSAVTQPVSGTVTTTPPSNASSNIAQINGVTPLMGNGVSGTGAQRVTLASDSTGQVAIATGSNTIGALTANQSMNLAQTAGNTTLTGNGVTGTGSQRVTIASDNTAFTVNANEIPITTGGLTQFRLVSAATTNATTVKASQGNVYNIEVFNNGAAACYIKFYNLAGSITVGTSTTTKVMMIPAGGGLVLNSAIGIQFSTGISFALTTNLVDTDTTAIAINQVAVSIDYK